MSYQWNRPYATALSVARIDETLCSHWCPWFGENQAKRKTKRLFAMLLSVWRTVQKGLLFIMHPVQLEWIGAGGYVDEEERHRALLFTFCRTFYTTQSMDMAEQETAIYERYCCGASPCRKLRGKWNAEKWINVIKTNDIWKLNWRGNFVKYNVQ